MTRDEEILKAARYYVSGVTLSSPSNVIHFENGAKWADEHPNLASLWHNAKEEPKGDNYKILCVDDFDFYWMAKRAGIIGLYNNWEEYTVTEGVKIWAYISDLLPKQLGNSKQEKGGKNENN